jgi:hypothetical protein
MNVALVTELHEGKSIVPKFDHLIPKPTLSEIVLARRACMRMGAEDCMAELGLL